MFKVPGPGCADAGLQVDHRQQGWQAGREARRPERPLQCLQVTKDMIIGPRFRENMDIDHVLFDHHRQSNVLAFIVHQDM